MENKEEMNGITAYQYYIYQGELRVREGFVRHYPYSCDNLSRFYYEKDGRQQRAECAPEPGVFHNDQIWLPERDDKKAKALFIKRRQAKITALNDEIKRNKAQIAAIRKAKL